MAQNITQIPAARVPLVDPESGLVNRDWYRFLSNLYTLAGQGSNAISLDDLQLGPTSGGSGKRSAALASIFSTKVGTCATLGQEEEVCQFSVFSAKMSSSSHYVG